MRPDLGQRTRAAALTEASRSLGALLDRDPRARLLVDSPEPLPDRSGYIEVLHLAHLSDGESGFRAERRRRLAQIAAHDVYGDAGFEIAAAALADLADASIEVALEAVGAPDALAVVGMGKLGGRELNYASDIDVMFVCGSDLEDATRAAERVIAFLTAYAPEGQAYAVDADLRPEGRAGALVRTLDGCLEYYRRWAKEWEFQALIKARWAAGSAEVGRALVAETRPLVFPEEVTPERVAAIRRIKERVETQAVRSTRPGRVSDDDVKLGPGGIRDIEFAIQLLQLVHGGSDDSVRSPNTLAALAALVENGYLADDDGAGLAVAYRWLRTVEHRLQLWQERRIHRLPADSEQRARVARVLGFRDAPARGAREGFESAHRGVLTDVRGRFERLFYRPMIESLAGAGPGRLAPDALRERLGVLGFRDVERAARTLSELVGGTSRRAKLFRVLSPAMLRYLALQPLPDEGLFSFLRLSEALGDRVDVAGQLRDNPPGIEFLARVLGSGRLLGDVLIHLPEEVATIADPRGPGAPKDRDRLVREASSSLGWREPERKLDGLRRYKRREFFRIALSDLAGEADVAGVGAGLADLADACLEAALERTDAQFAVIGMGKLGGRELNYASDIDVMFVHDCEVETADHIAEQLVGAIGEVTPEGQAFEIDLALRPEGRSGPLVRSLDSCLEYYGRWARPWEHLALIKARVAAGDRALGHRLVGATRAYAFPERPGPSAVAEIRHLKARMERERIPRGTDPRRNLKLGPGGISDVEFAIQILQLSHGATVESLRCVGTLPALAAARAAGILAPDEADRLHAAYEFLSRLRNRLYFLVGRPVDVLPVKPEELEALGIAMGYEDQPRQEVEEDYLRITRRARTVAEPLIYGRAR